MHEHIREIRTFCASDNHRASLNEARELAINERCEVMLTLAESGSGSITLSIDGRADLDTLMLRLQEGFEASRKLLYPQYKRPVNNSEISVFLGRYGGYDLHAFIAGYADVDEGPDLGVEVRFGDHPEHDAHHELEEGIVPLEAAVTEAWRRVCERGLGERDAYTLEYKKKGGKP